jgi:CheY-like chemotaxis protein/two-component sensor histidine kinase
MSHELRTPLNAILGYAQLFELTGVSEDQRQPVQQILASGRHLLDLINEVLDISRIDANKLSLAVESVDISEVIHSTVDMLRPAALTAGIELQVHGDCGSTMVLADRQRLCQILVNLLSNAVKYNHRGGDAVIACCHTDDQTVRISVTDTGRGISKDKFDLVFTPFERLDADATDVEGTGMGLAVSSRLAEAMGATIGLDSVIGEGSTFWIDLPLATPVAIPAQPDAEAADHTGPGAAHSTVLLVEDNPANIKLVKRIVELAGDARLITTDSGRAAVDIAVTMQPDLILLDLHLPDIDGQRVLAALRIDPRTAAIPIVVLSADTSPGQIERLLDAGAAAYLTKPIEVRELLNLVHTTGGTR